MLILQVKYKKHKRTTAPNAPASGRLGSPNLSRELHTPCSSMLSPFGGGGGGGGKKSKEGLEPPQVAPGPGPAGINILRAALTGSSEVSQSTYAYALHDE